MNENIHPFEASGCGIGPFQFVGIAEIPSNELAGQNPDAHRNMMRALPKLDGGCGTCRHCGMAIMIVCIVRDSTGKQFGVGSDCIKKVDQGALGNAAKVAVARRRRELARQKREQKREEERQAWLASPEGQEHQRKQKEAREAQERAGQAIRDRWAFMVPSLERRQDRSGFCRSILDGITNERWPSEPQGRAVEILQKIWIEDGGTEEEFSGK